jgi:hypothetical protein
MPVRISATRAKILPHLVDFLLIIDKLHNNKYKESNKNNGDQYYIYFINHIINIYYFYFTSLDILRGYNLDLLSGSGQLKKTGLAMDHLE